MSNFFQTQPHPAPQSPVASRENDTEGRFSWLIRCLIIDDTEAFMLLCLSNRLWNGVWGTQWSESRSVAGGRAQRSPPNACRRETPAGFLSSLLRSAA